MRNALTAAGIRAGLAGSAVALALAPALMPDSYSWLEHTTSDSAAQGVHGAWLARAGFLLLGLSVLALATVRGRGWGPAGAWLHRAFGALMVSAGVFSSRSWLPGTAYDPTEDVLHSVAATAMGFAFALGIVAVLVPVGMTVAPEVAGALQRVMFLVAYAWYATEAARALR